MHGGTVSATSPGQGQGSEFTVRLPVVHRFAAIHPDNSLKNGQHQKAHSRRVLIVDDNRDSARTLSMSLRLGGHETATAHDGVEAIKTAQEFQPDIVLLDIGLPKLNGYEVCRRLRELRDRNVLIVALTGWGQEDDRRQSAAAGFDLHLVKPINLPMLEELLASRESTQEPIVA
jgi:CheY-like chemotaxis protein